MTSHGQVRIVCTASKGRRPCRRILAEGHYTGPLTIRPGITWSAVPAPGAQDHLAIATLYIRCPEHGEATVTGAELAAAVASARRGLGEIRVAPARFDRREPM